MPIPGAYRSAMIRPRCVMTRPSVIASGGPNARSAAAAIAAASRPAGNGVRGSTSPIGHGVVAASGRFGRTMEGRNARVSTPTGSVTHP